MRAAVLGGCGFIGSHIVDALRVAGHEVTVFDRAMDRYRDPVPGVNYMLGNFSDKMALSEALIGKDTVFHLISTTFPSTASLDPKADVGGNLIGTLNLIETMRALKIRRLVFLSSGGTVYGVAPGHPVPENYPLNPITSYGIVKVAIENYLEMDRRNEGLQPISIRAANPFGPRQGHAGVQGVVATFMRRIRDGQPVEIWGDGRVVRDFLYVSDLARLCVLAAESSLCGALNAGSGRGHSILEVIDALSVVTKRSITPTFMESRSIDVPYSVLDISRARKLLNWEPATEFRSGLRATWEWMQDASL
jgi:UDP-glucose 4-epimerase